MLRVSISALSGWLPVCATLFFGLWAAWKLSKPKLTSYAKKLGLIPSRTVSDREAEEAREAMKRLKDLTKPADDRDDRRGFSRIWGAILSMTLIASWATGIGIVLHDHRKLGQDQRRISQLEAELALYRSGTVVEHNLTFLGRDLETHDFDFISAEEPNGGSLHPCPNDRQNGVDTEALLTAAIGWPLSTVRWEERGMCKSMLRADLGIWYKDKSNFKLTGGH